MRFFILLICVKILGQQTKNLTAEADSDGDGCVTNKSEMDDTASNRPLDNDSKEMLFFPANVQAAISEVFSTDDFDPLDAPEFSAIGT